MGSHCFALLFGFGFFSFFEGIFWILCACGGFERSRFVVELKNTKIKVFYFSTLQYKRKMELAFEYKSRYALNGTTITWKVTTKNFAV